jgi:DNA-binding transcriptional LysR family regulator
VAEILARVETVMASAAPFDPATSRRRFLIGAPDAVLASAMVSLLRSIAGKAPGIDIGLIHLMPAQSGGSMEQPWQQGLNMLEARKLDLAMLPLRSAPPRFEARKIYDEDFVLAMRKGHALRKTPTAAAFSRSQHILVSVSGEPHGFVDDILAGQGLKRRIVLTVPNFMTALVQLSNSDLVAALPRRLVAHYAGRFGLEFAELPFTRKSDTIQAIATRAAMKDDGIAWLMQNVVDSIAGDRHPVNARR